MEAKDTPKIQFLEKAAPPYKKSWPKRILIVAFGLFMGFAISFLIIILTDIYQKYIRDENNKEKVSKIIDLF